MEKKSLFRKQSCEQLSDPDQINEYLRVVSTPIWLIFIAVIIMIVGTITWASIAVLEQKQQVLIEVTDDASYAVIGAEDINNISLGLQVKLNDGDGEYEVEYIDKTASSKWLDDELAPYVNFFDGDWIYKYQISDTNLCPGVYEGYIVMGTYHPISFLIQ